MEIEEKVRKKIKELINSGNELKCGNKCGQVRN